MQASSEPWVPPAGTLGEIIDQTRARVKQARATADEFQARARDVPDPPPFAQALRRETVSIIAEIKRRSPSKGAINESISPARQALAYSKGGAAAISVLTEPFSFCGALQDLQAAREGTQLPLLRKDFIIDESQIDEARVFGASAVLLIVRALEPDLLTRLVAHAATQRIETLVEVRSEAELQRALALPVSVIGVNTRNLETLELDPAVPARLLPLIPADRVAVAESGIRSREDATRSAALGADALLVGSSISASPDPESAVRSLSAIPRKGRANRS